MTEFLIIYFGIALFWFGFGVATLHESKGEVNGYVLAVAFSMALIWPGMLFMQPKGRDRG